MATATNPLQNVQVASPCAASWDRMQGTDKVRFCADCQLNVYNLSAMNRKEAATFLRQREGRTCVRFYRRHDGTVLTQDCPRGLAALRRGTRRAVGALVGFVSAMLFLMFGLLLLVSGSRRDGSNFDIHQIEPFRTVESWLPWSPPPVITGECLPLNHENEPSHPPVN